MTDVHTRNKELIRPLRRAPYDYESEGVQAALSQVFAPDAMVRLAYPFEDLDGPEGLYRDALAPLHASIPDLERRDTIVMAGTSKLGNDWVGCGGYYTGIFTHLWLHIPPTRHQVAMRCHDVMRLADYWHPRCSWYGPSGIGTGGGIDGFRDWHQVPFLNAMPDRVGTLGKEDLFADGDYVGFTAWPGMEATISNDGWLGIAPSGQQVTMRSLDFWRCEQGRIRENWVLVDLLDVYKQIGVDVFARLREFNKARSL